MSGLQRRRDATSLLDDSFSSPAERLAAAAAGSSGSSLKRGFLVSGSSKSSSSSSAAISIPEAVEVHQREEELPALFLFNSMLQEGLVKPTDEMLKSVLGNEDVRKGFRDPEIMAAVREIAKDRGALQKYQSNSRVMSFYSQLQKYMGTSRIIDSFSRE